jgi:hypothetical protein
MPTDAAALHVMSSQVPPPMAVNSNVNRPAPLRSAVPHAVLVGTVLVFAPRFAAPDSHLITGPRDRALTATAHLDFKIVIPPVLGLGFEASRDRAGAIGITLLGNTHGLLLASSALGAGRSLVLTAGSRHAIIEQTHCIVAPTRLHTPVICTASMP